MGLESNIVSLVLIVAADGILLGLIVALLKIPSPKVYKQARKLTLAVFAAGMLAILIASLSIF